MSKKKVKKTKKRLRLPNEIIKLPNPDKLFHEKWKEGRNMANLPHPFRGVLLGPPNVGKTTFVKNILLRSNPPFEEIVVIHCDSEYTKEYDDVDAEILNEIPSPEDWEGEVKTLVVLDDLEYKGMNKEQKRNLDRLFGYVSTHKNISCLLCSQDAFNVPPIVRRCSNIFVLWKCPDMDSMANISRKSGLKKDELSNIFKNVCNEGRDSLMIDLTPKSPYPLRKNLFIKLKKMLVNNKNNV
jgi:hypothetical protein